MTRGLSRLQRAVLAAIQKEGYELCLIPGQRLAQLIKQNGQGNCQMRVVSFKPVAALVEAGCLIQTSDSLPGLILYYRSKN